MANYEKQVEQEAAYPIPISLYNCYRTVRHEKRYISGVAMPHCPVTGVQRYRDGVCSLLFHLFFIIWHPYIPEEMIFLYLFYPFFTVLNAPSKTILEYSTRGSNSDRTVRRYARVSDQLSTTSNIGRAYVIRKEAKRKIITASER